MADFRTHVMGAAVVSGVAATALVMTEMVTNQAVVGYFILGVSGGLLPDIDSDTSIPVRVAFNMLAVVSGFLLVFAFSQRFSLLELVILWLACFVAIRYFAFNLFTYITVHRGLWHSIPAGVLCGLLATVLAYHGFGAAALHAWFCGIFVLLGFLVHLLLDEFYSVNLLGMELKSSFGTALKLGSANQLWSTLTLYLAIFGLLYVSPPFDAFLQMVLDGSIYRDIDNRLLPQQEWFKSLLGSCC